MKSSSLSLWHIFVSFMEKESYTKFCNVLVRFNKVIKLQSFEFSVSDVIPANLRNISPLFSLYFVFVLWRKSILVSFMVFLTILHELMKFI